MKRTSIALGYMTPVGFATKWREKPQCYSLNRWANDWGPDKDEFK